MAWTRASETSLLKHNRRLRQKHSLPLNAAKGILGDWNFASPPSMLVWSMGKAVVGLDEVPSSWSFFGHLGHAACTGCAVAPARCKRREWRPKFRIFKNPRWRRHLENHKNRDISATVWPIFTKFGTLMHSNQSIMYFWVVQVNHFRIHWRWGLI